MKLNEYIDHTFLKANATRADIEKLCNEAISYNFFAVCVNSGYVSFAREILKGSAVKIASTIGFPLGASNCKSKVTEALEAIKDGADEIDMVLNIGLLKNGSYSEVEKEIAKVKNAIGTHILKVILETCYLTDEEIVKACQLAENARADFVKTSTGFGSRGATYKDIELMKSAIGNTMQIKASGGIRDFKTAEKYILMGVNRLGTSSGIDLLLNNSSNPRDSESY